MDYPKELMTTVLLKKLVGRDVDVVLGRKPTTIGKQAVAEYHDDEGNPVAWLTAEMSFAAASACALMLFPAVRVKEAVKEDALSEELHDGFYEVANVASRWFNDGQDKHVTLRELRYHESRDADFKDMWRKSRKEGQHYVVEIKGFGKGNLWLYMP